MAWTAPRTWTSGETVTASIMNTHVRDNLSALATESTGNVADITELQSVVSAANLVADPTFLIWAAGDTVAPTHWGITTTSGTVARCGTGLGDTKRKVGAYSVQIAATATGAQQIRQFLLTTDSYDDFVDATAVSLGAWVYCTASSSARIFVDDGSGATYSSYAAGSTSWEWLTVTRTLGSTGTYLAIGAEAIASATLNLSGPTAVLGSQPPTRYQAPPVAYGSFWVQVAGALSTSGMTQVATLHPGRPLLIKDVQAYLKTGSTAAATVIDVNVGGNSIFAGTTSLLSVAATTASSLSIAAGRQPESTGTYQYRCAEAVFGATSTSGQITIDVDSAGAGAADLTIHVRGLQFLRPQENMLGYADIR